MKLHTNSKLYIIPTGGLANRMRAIASAYSLSKATKRRLCVIWHEDKGLNADFKELFEYDVSLFEIKRLNPIKYKFFYEVPRKSNFYFSSIAHLFSDKIWIYQLDQKDFKMNEDFFLQKVVSTGKDVVIKSCYSFFSFTREDILSLFPPSKKVKEREKEILEYHNPAVALQIRRTDNVWAIQHSPLELFETVIDEEYKRNEDVKIFLATDDESVKRRLKDKYGKIIVSNPKEARRDTLEGMVDAFAEMEIMSKCERIYGSYWSSFSEIAAMMGNSDLIVLKE